MTEKPREKKQGPPLSIRLDEDLAPLLSALMGKTALKKHAIVVAAVREGLRVFSQDITRLYAAHAKEKLPPEEAK